MKQESYYLEAITGEYLQLNIYDHVLEMDRELVCVVQVCPFRERTEYKETYDGCTTYVADYIVYYSEGDSE